MAYRTVPFPMTLSDRQGRSPTASLFKRDFSFGCASADKMLNKSLAVAEMGDRGHNKHGRKEGGGCCAPFTDSWDHV